METFTNKKFGDMTSEELEQLITYLTREFWDKQIESIKCPICGGTITTVERGSGSITDCSTPGCVHLELRGL